MNSYGLLLPYTLTSCAEYSKRTIRLRERKRKRKKQIHTKKIRSFIKTDEIRCVVRFFSLFGSLVRFSFFLHTHKPNTWTIQSNIFIISIRFIERALLCQQRWSLPITITHTLLFCRSIFSIYLFPSFSCTRSFQMRRPSTQSSTSPVMCK